MGVGMSGHRPNYYQTFLRDGHSYNGCNVNCPYVPSRHREDEGFGPSGGPDEGYRNTRRTY